MPGRNVQVEVGTLRRLISSLEEFWEDHSFAKTDDNPNWVRDRSAIEQARESLREK